MIKLKSSLRTLGMFKIASAFWTSRFKTSTVLLIRQYSKLFNFFGRIILNYLFRFMFQIISFVVTILIFFETEVKNLIWPETNTKKPKLSNHITNVAIQMRNISRSGKIMSQAPTTVSRLVQFSNVTKLSLVLNGLHVIKWKSENQANKNLDFNAKLELFLILHCVVFWSGLSGFKTHKDLA